MRKTGVIAERLALIGVGLIGGSLMKGLRAAGAVGEVVGVARTEATLQRALELDVIDRAETRIEAAVKRAGMVVIATPMQAMPQVLKRVAASMDAAAVITDVGSVKSYVAAAAREHMSDRVDRFVPGHPIAGREHAGVEAAEAGLFRGKTVILTPTNYTSVDALQRVARMWELVGAQVETLDPGVHDRLLAATSHLPHIVAYALVDFLAQQEESAMLFELAAGGFYDFTRIASSDPVMWRDICITNREAVLDSLRGYRANIDHLLQAIENKDGDALHRCFSHAKQSRDAGLKNKYSASRG